MNSVQQPQPSAPESSAGDDFHLLWASKKLLELLRPMNSLKAIFIEGVSPKEAEIVDPRGDQLLGVDLTEYYGAQNFEDADNVVYSQLKYSTRQSQASWTAARLAEAKNGNKTNSIINRLAQIYSSYAKNKGRAVVLQKLSIHFISNRPCSDTLNDALTQAKSLLRTRANKVYLKNLLKQMVDAYAKDIQRLKDACKLNSVEFTDFLRVLDLAQCGESSRLDQTIEVIGELGNIGFPDAKVQYDQLKSYVWQRMQPESRQKSVITTHDVVPIFSIASYDHLFPVPSRLKRMGQIVERSQAASIASNIIKAHHPVCLHGRGGIGKTTILLSLADYLPKGSVCLFFDCYGNGSYLDPADMRHGHSRAILQIANELAAQTGSHLLLNNRGRPEELLRELRNRLNAAIQIMSKNNPEALVVLIVDAADNSVIAAKQQNERSFIHDLVKMEMSGRFRLVVSARSHRIDDLLLPQQAIKCEINPFELKETAEHIKFMGCSASDNEVVKFHDLSGGIPRVQNYALTSSNAKIANSIALLEPSGNTIDEIIDKQIEDAVKRIGDLTFAQSVIPVILSLPRPVPITYVAILSTKKEQDILDFCTDLPSGMVVLDNHISFKDEDFEGRLQQNYQPSNCDYSRLADVFMENSPKDIYAASHLADSLLHADRKEDLVKLVYNEESLDMIKDHIERTNIATRRTELALRVTLEINNPVEVIRMLIVVARYSKTDQAVETLLFNNADLACRHGNAEKIQRLYLNPKNEQASWYGPTHLLCAANFSRNNTTYGFARESIKSAEGWINYRSGLTDEEREECNLTCEDIAYGAEAILRLDGYAASVKWLSKWRPKGVLFSAVESLVYNLLTLEGEDAFQWFDQTQIRADWLLAIINAAITKGLRPPKEIVFRAVSVWCKLVDKEYKANLDLIPLGISLCEAAAFHGTNPSEIKKLLNIFTPNVPEHYMRYYLREYVKEYDLWIRYKTLYAVINSEELTGADSSLLPVRLQNEQANIGYDEKKRWEEDRKEFVEFYKFLIPAYLLRAKALFIRHHSDAFEKELIGAIKTNDWEWSPRGRFGKKTEAIRQRAEALIDASVWSLPQPESICHEICDHYCMDRPYRLKLELAKKLSINNKLYQTTIKLVSDVEQIIMAEALPSSELIKTFAECCRIVGSIDNPLGMYYFDHAVKSASEIDDEAFGLVSLLSRISKQLHNSKNRINEPKLAKDLSVVSESCYWRLEGEDGFPWTQCIQGITYLSPPVAATCISRWDLRNLRNFAKNIDDFVRACLSTNTFTPETAIAWSVLSMPGDASALKTSLDSLIKIKSMNKVNTDNFGNGISIVADDAIKLAPLNERLNLANDVVEWAIENDIEDEAAIRDLIHFLKLHRKMDECEDNIPEPEQCDNKQLVNTVQEVDPEETIDWDMLLEKYDFCDPSGIENVISELLDILDRSELPNHHKYSMIDKLLVKIKNHIRVSDYCKHMTALFSANTESLTLTELITATKSRLDAWSFHPFVMEWKKTMPDLLAKYHFDQLFYSCYGVNDVQLLELQQQLGVSRFDIIQAIAKVLPDHINDVTAIGIYSIAEGIVKKLHPKEAKALLEIVLPDVRTRIEKGKLYCKEIEEPLIPEGSSLEATLLWYLLGHPDTRIRWQSAHAIRRMVRMGNEHVISELAVWLDYDKEHPFVIPGDTFYRMAARQWFFILTDRLSLESPKSLLLIRERLAIEAIEPKTPHVLAMYYAKRAALKLYEHDATAYDRHQFIALESALTPLEHDLSNIEECFDPRDDYDSVKTERFDFDHTDTLPYLYSRAGAVFNISALDFCRAAERWICDKWGKQNSSCHNDPVIKWYVRDSEWYLTSNDHGSLPVIEKIQDYLEINAMYCVMGELISTKHVKEYEWETHIWENWLSRWDLTWDTKWLADLRQKTPVESMLWYWDQGDRNQAWNIITDNDMARAVGFLSPLHDGYWVVDASWNRYEYGNYERLDINSALVSQETSLSLVNALSECNHYRDYAIPYEKCEPDWEINEQLTNGTRFLLNGWIQCLYDGPAGLDENDPLRHGLKKVLKIPGSKVQENMILTFNDDRTESYVRNDTESPVSIFEHWNDFPPHDRSNEFKTEGNRLWFRSKDLLAFLKQYGFDLIIQCVLHRKENKSHYLKQEDENDERVLL